MPRRRSATAALACVLAVVAGTVAAAASGAAPRADRHDRAAIEQLLAQQLAIPTKADAALVGIASACPAWRARGADRAELRASLVVPAEYFFGDAHESHYAAYRSALARVSPHALAFRDWLAMERIEAALGLQFYRELDRSRLDVCAYLAEVAATDWDTATPLLFVELRDTLAVQAYWSGMAVLSGEREAADARFARVLRASGFTKGQIAALTD